MHPLELVANSSCRARQECPQDLPGAASLSPMLQGQGQESRVVH